MFWQLFDFVCTYKYCRLIFEFFTSLQAHLFFLSFNALKPSVIHLIAAHLLLFASWKKICFMHISDYFVVFFLESCVLLFLFLFVLFFLPFPFFCYTRFKLYKFKFLKCEWLYRNFSQNSWIYLNGEVSGKLSEISKIIGNRIVISLHYGCIE